MSDYGTLKLALADRVATVTFNRPHRLNALTPHMVREAETAIDVALEQGARALVLTGEGRAFCSGADLMPDDLGNDGLPDDLGVFLDEVYNPFVRKLAGLDIPVITAVNGPAAGAGAGLALAGDLVIAARSAYFQLSFVNIGLVPDAGSTWLVAHSLGRIRAMEMALLGERLTADAAMEAGLVTRVVDDLHGSVLAEAQAMARRLAAGPSVAVGLIRKQVAAALTQTLDETLETERTNQGRAGFTADFREALAAFSEKRHPNFKGE